VHGNEETLRLRLRKYTNDAHFSLIQYYMQKHNPITNVEPKKENPSLHSSLEQKNRIGMDAVRRISK